MVDEKLSKKRRLRPANNDTVRERSEKIQQQSRNQVDAPKRVKKAYRRSVTPFRIIGQIIKWVGRHIIPRYFRTAFTELRQVTWPNRKETRQLTSAVILFAIVFGFFIAIIDLGLDKVFKRVLLKQ